MNGEREIFPSLTGLRFVLALWIALYHLTVLYGAPSLAQSPWIAIGYARVDVFFVLSGFVLTHVYTFGARAKFDFGAFMAARVGRLYPLHLLALLLIACAVIGTRLIGRDDLFQYQTLQGFVGNLLMLQSFGWPETGNWNYPAWTLSAEFAAYFFFPLLVLAAAAFGRRAIVFFAIVVAVIGVADFLWASMRDDTLAGQSVQFGFVRGICCFAVGVAARFVFERLNLTTMFALGAALLGAVFVAGAALATDSLAAVAFGAAFLIGGLAALDRNKIATPLAHPIMQELGRWSYGLFILHFPIFMIGEPALKIMGWEGDVGLAKGGLLLLAAIVASAPAHHWVEEPVRKAIRGLYAKWVNRRAQGKGSVQAAGD